MSSTFTFEKAHSFCLRNRRALTNCTDEIAAGFNFSKTKIALSCATEVAFVNGPLHPVLRVLPKRNKEVFETISYSLRKMFKCWERETKKKIRVLYRSRNHDFVHTGRMLYP